MPPGWKLPFQSWLRLKPLQLQSGSRLYCWVSLGYSGVFLSFGQCRWQPHAAGILARQWNRGLPSCLSICRHQRRKPQLWSVLAAQSDSQLWSWWPIAGSSYRVLLLSTPISPTWCPAAWIPKEKDLKDWTCPYLASPCRQMTSLIFKRDLPDWNLLLLKLRRPNHLPNQIFLFLLLPCPGAGCGIRIVNRAYYLF